MASQHEAWLATQLDRERAEHEATRATLNALIEAGEGLERIFETAYSGMCPPPSDWVKRVDKWHEALAAAKKLRGGA